MPSSKIWLVEIEKIAKAHHLEDPLSSFEAMTRFLEFWWCQKFNRPFKDPLLKSYTRNELLYEFLRYHFIKPEHDPLMEEERKEKLSKEKEVKDADLDWIKRELNSAGVGGAEADALIVESEKPSESIPESLPDISTTFDDT